MLSDLLLNISGPKTKSICSSAEVSNTLREFEPLLVFESRAATGCRDPAGAQEQGDAVSQDGCNAVTNGAWPHIKVRHVLTFDPLVADLILVLNTGAMDLRPQ